MPIAIRPYTRADWSGICRVHDLARPDELRGSFDARAFIPLADDPESRTIDDCEMFVVEHDDQVIAFAGIDVPYLAWMYVDPAHYREGTGRALLRHCMTRLGDDAWTLACGANQAALALYLDEGFVIEHRDMGINAGYEGPSARLALHPEREGWKRPRRSEAS